MNGIMLIAAERQRQVEEEGWTPEHDDRHSSGALAAGGACYANFARLQLEGDPAALAATGPLAHTVAPPAAWPWDWDWWKPSEDPTRNLVKAGALIAAALDRLQRAKGHPTAPDPEELHALYAHCREFFREQRITFPEVIYQTDRVIENAYEFIAGVGQVIGYEPIPDED